MRLFALLLLAGCAKKELPPPTIKPLLFDTSSIEFAPASAADDQAILEHAAKILDADEFHVVLVGLADSTGDPEANKVLSQQRADHVAELLKPMTKFPGHIKTFAVGEMLATGEHVAERKVEFVFYRDDGRPIPKVVADARALRDDEARKNAEEHKK